MLRTSALTFALIFTATGCLSTSHRVSRSELIRLSHVPPEQRSEAVKVKQSFTGDDGPPLAPRSEGGVYVAAGAQVSPAPRTRYPRTKRAPDKAKQAKQDNKFWFVLAALAAVGLAATEGVRYIGWVRLHPMHPIHLYGPYGEYSVMPLAHVDPETAAWAQKAFVRETEGPTWARLQRAPLDRTGLGYSILLGGSELITDDGMESSGFASHVQFSLFPVNHIGLAIDLFAGWRDNATGQVITDNRNAFELQIFPLAAGSVHLGVFGQVGFGIRLDDTTRNDDSSVLFAGGAMAQLELTTTLALTLRGQVTQIYDTQASAFTVGISVY